ncbi:MAG: PAS domain S-box protein [Phormidium tanganyikae FI6-MK23]|jgi:PAS domain S-box-containing protein|nr:PAS domain S-box protein [Phormidium tanganyikae FI6-MK23]
MPHSVTLNDILITEELSQRIASQISQKSLHSPDWQAEAQAMQSLARSMVQEPESLPQRLVETALELCQAGTAGISLLETTSDGKEILRWAALAGTLAQYVGKTIPRNLSPCGICIDRQSPQLFSHPEYYSTYFQAANTSIVEGLALPLIVDRRALGTIWIMSHDETRQFDSEDVRIMTSLADFAATALILNRHQTQELRAANAQLEEDQRSHEALRESEERLRVMIEKLPGGAAFIVDRDLRYVLAEGEALAIAGFKPEDLVGYTLSEVMPPELLPTYEVLYRQCLAGEAFEHEHNSHDRFYISRGTPLRSSNGEVYATLVVSYDITDRKKSEESLRESEEHFRQVADAVPQIIWITDSEGRVEFLNKQWSDYTGLPYEPTTAAEAAGTFVHPDDGALTMEAFNEARRTSSVFEVEHRIRSKTGTYRWFLVRAEPYRDPQTGKVVRWFGASTDIHDRKLAEAARRESEEKYRSLFNSIDEGYILCDVIFDENDQPINILYLAANPAAVKMTGTELVGRRTRELDPNYESQWFETFGRVAKTGVAERHEIYTAPLDTWYNCYVFKVGAPNDTKIAAVYQDISDRKRREANQTFLAEITDDMSRLSTAEEIMETVGAKIGAYLEVKSCLFVDVDDARGEVTVFDAWNTAGVPSLRHQTIRLSDFISEEFSRANRSGEGAVVRNTRTDPRCEGKDYTAVGIGAFVTVPFHRNGLWTNYLAVTDSESHDWRDDEIELFRELSNRIFPRLDRAHAEAALRESEARMQKAVSAETVGVLFFSLDGGMQDANEAFIGMSGYTRDELQNAVHWETLTPPEFRDITLRTAAELAEKGETAPYEKQLFRKDGSRWWGLFAPTRLSGSGLESQCVEFIIDITERKQNEESLRESEARIAADLAGMRRLYELQSKLADQNDVKAALQDVLAVACEFTSTDRGCVQLLSDDGERLEMAVWQGYADDGPFISFFRYEGLRTGCEVARVYRQRMIIEDTVGFPGLDGTDAGAASHAEGIRASQSTPMAGRSGETIGVISTQFRQPHRSSDHELRLMDMLAWTAGEFLERHRADAALRQSEEKYRSLFEAINDGFCLIEMIFDENEKPLDYRFLEISPSFERQTGMTNVLSKRMRELDPDHEEYWFEIYGNVVLTGQPIRFENRAEGLDGWFDVYAFPDGEPENRRVAIVFNNITDRKRAEAERLQRIQEQAAHEEEHQRAEALAELGRAKTIFFSNVSHEFRTPLTLLLNPLQDALNDRTSPLPAAQKERVELAHRNSLRLMKLVNTLLDFSRLEAGRMEVVYEPTDLSQFTTELASVFRSAIEQAGLQLIVDCPPLPEIVYIDREMWEKIVLNLLSNAFKFTFEGEITVSLRAELGVEPQALTLNDSGFTSELQAQTLELEVSPSDLETTSLKKQTPTSELEISSSELETSLSDLDTPTLKLEAPRSQLKTSASFPHIVLKVQDTGVGVPPDELPHLFERFYQVRGTQARAHEGSGIGLSLVHELIKLHGGTIEVSSIVGEGTCFTIVLPLGTEHLPNDRLQSEGDRIQPTRTLTSTAIGTAPYVQEAELWRSEDRRETPTHARVLLVDDNADMRDYLTRILSDHVQVESVADGTAALSAARSQVPDLILSDVMMPGLDGFQLLQALRADPGTRGIPIILLSARAGEEAIVEALEAGADDYLIKPFSTQELISRVNTHLQRGKVLHQERTNSRRKDDLLSTVSHELSTPLVSILGWTRLLRSSPPTPVLLAKALSTIERNATLQAKLVQDLLDISRITAGKLRLNLQPIELTSVIEMAIATVDQTAQAKEVKLIWQQNRMHPLVMADRDRLQQVICNLLSNAIKFTPEGGSVTVELSGTKKQNIAHCEIRVTDTGIGISAEFLSHVFDRFWQAPESVKGIGLGLAIAQHLVELHNGAIDAQSAGEGQGATFSVYLPLLEELT